MSKPQGYTAGMHSYSLKRKKKIGWVRGRSPHFFMACLLVMSLIDTAIADSFRCGRKVVHTGDSPGDLLQNCGEPRYKDKGYENTRAQGSQKKVRVERWYYKKNSRSLEQIVVIHKGRIIAINTGQR
jgi:ribosomal protein S8E